MCEHLWVVWLCFHGMGFQRQAYGCSYMTMQVGKAHDKCPATMALLTDSDILMTTGFDREADKNKVQSWRDGDEGQDLQVRMAQLLGERYFDYGLGKDATSGTSFRTGGEWAAFARLHPVILNCFKEQFGLNQAYWGPKPAARWSDIMRGKWDAELKTLSDSIPDACPTESAEIMDIVRPPEELAQRMNIVSRNHGHGPARLV